MFDRISTWWSNNHNRSVLLNKNKKPCYSPESFILLDPDELHKMDHLEIYFNDILFDKYDIEIFYAYQLTFDITPFTYNTTNKMVYNKDNVFFIQLYLNSHPDHIKIKIIIKYKDNTDKILEKDDISFMRY